MTNHQVVIAGAGPTGLMLAAELALAGVDLVVVERRETQALESARGGGLHARTIEVLDQRGVAERFVSQGQAHRATHFLIPFDLSDCPSRHNYTLALPQERFERILAGWVEELGVRILRGREVTGFVEHHGGVRVALSDGQSLAASYLVGCDGARSAIRKTAGIDFVGWDASTSYLLAEVEMAEEPVLGFRRDDAGFHAIGKLDDGRARLVLVEPEVRRGDHPSFDELRARLVAVYGKDFGARNPSWIARFTDAARQATAYRKGRVLLAGDAAHAHSPVGGQGLNLGVQDAVNLGWKLAQVVRGASPDASLDTYEAERHPVAASVLRLTMALTALRRGDERSEALRETMTELLRMDEPRRRMAARLSALDIRYDLGDGHPLLGRRMPDLDLGSQRVYELLRDARPLLLELAGPSLAAPAVRRVRARYEGPWELPAIGAVAPPSAVLIRPDGHVAWVGDGTDRGLREALTKWFGDRID